MPQGYQFYLREEDGRTLKMRNVPGDAISICRDSGNVIEIDFALLEHNQYYCLFANSTMYVLQRTNTDAIILVPSDEAINRYEQETGWRIPRKSVDEIEYDLVPRLGLGIS